MVYIWGYIGGIINQKIKTKYFEYILRQEQAWFDSINTFELYLLLNLTASLTT